MARRVMPSGGGTETDGKSSWVAKETSDLSEVAIATKRSYVPTVTIVTDGSPDHLQRNTGDKDEYDIIIGQLQFV